MPRAETLGQFEQMVLTAVLSLARHTDGAYGITIHDKVQKLARPRRVSLGAVYVTLDRLEEKGFVSSWLSDPTTARGGRAKRHYRIEPSGERALHDAADAARRLWTAFEDALDARGTGRRRLAKAWK
jgi:DNA-binding PadR family transcriptional regulator